MAEAKPKASTPVQRAPVAHAITEKIPLLLSLYAQGGRDGVLFAAGERESQDILDRSRRESPEYLKGVLAGVAFVVGRSLEHPGDDPGERRARRFLLSFMRRYPTPPRGVTKPRLKSWCMRKFEIGSRSFDRLWAWAIDRTGTIAYQDPGRRSGR